MKNEWIEYKGYGYLVSSAALFAGRPREWSFDIRGIADKETIVWHGTAPSAVRAEAAARKWIDEH